jgi:hypothetical protein
LLDKHTVCIQLFEFLGPTRRLIQAGLSSQRNCPTSTLLLLDVERISRMILWQHYDKSEDIIPIVSRGMVKDGLLQAGTRAIVNDQRVSRHPTWARLHWLMTPRPGRSHPTNCHDRVIGSTRVLGAALEPPPSIHRCKRL